MFQHTAPRRWLLLAHCGFALHWRFNTQPPEGGCFDCGLIYIINRSFNTQPPEGGCIPGDDLIVSQCVSTHRHPKVAAVKVKLPLAATPVSTHSHPKVAASSSVFELAIPSVSTHSHPKVAAKSPYRDESNNVCFNTQPPEGGCRPQPFTPWRTLTFQHTATRRWLRTICI